MRPQDDGSLQGVDLPLCILLPHQQVKLLRRVSLIPTPHQTNGNLRIGHPLQHGFVHLHGEDVLLLQCQVPLLQVGDIPPQYGTLRVLVRNELFLTSIKDRTHLLFHSLLLTEELRPQDSSVSQTSIHGGNHLVLLVVLQRQAPGNPLFLEVGSLHVMELPSPLHLPGDHQIPDVEILKTLPLLLSPGLDVGDSGVRGEDISPLVGILLLVEREKFILVFQRTAREASSTRRLDAPTRTRGWNTPRGGAVGGWEDAVFTTYGAKTV